MMRDTEIIAVVNILYQLERIEYHKEGKVEHETEYQNSEINLTEIS